MNAPVPAQGSADEATLAGLLRGRFVVVEGPDGSGKTTQFRRLSELAKREGLEVCEVREPGGTPIGERIRDILLDTAFDEMGLRCEMMLYMASRAQLVAQTLKPAVDRGCSVLLAGHTNTERPYMPIPAKRLRAELPGLDMRVSEADAAPFGFFAGW